MGFIKKLSIFTSIVLLATFIFVLDTGAYSTDAGTISEKAEYLLDEDFSFLAINGSEIKPSGWDIRNAGGVFSYAYYSWFKISDTSNVLPVSMNKKFKAQSGGKITLEYRFKAVTVMDGLKWQLLSGNTLGVNIYTSGANLYMDTSSGSPILLQAYTANVDYGVKVIADITQNKADVYINGILKASGVAFKNTVSGLDNFNITTGEASTGDIYLATVKIHKGYTVNEKFITTMTNLPQGWNASASGGNISVQKMDNAAPPDLYSLKMDATASTAGMSFHKAIPAQTGAQVFEYKAFFPQKIDGVSAELLSGSTTALKLVTANGMLCYIDASGQAIPFYEYLPNLWYSIKVKLDTATSKADIYLNGKLKSQGVDFSANVSELDSIRFCTSMESKGIMCLDDILLYQQSPLPTDYVPEPVAVDTNGMLVGTQSCSLWREGHHLGWDYINPYPERKPILGFYDEGSPESADWEIKWMVEHGVSFEMFCWYRSYSTIGLPIKEPDMATALHDGYFNAEYSDQMNFAIAWENAASKAKDGADFRNNIVPYWIEYYLKDPRYLVIDNKPVISIYNYAALKKDFGGTTAGVKAEMDYLRAACKNIGFDDIILLTSYSAADPVVMSEHKAAGFDAVYAYSWGSLAGYPSIQQARLKQQRDAGTIDMIPVLSMGRDEASWGGVSGYFCTADELQSVAQWTKDTFIPSLPETSPGKNMVLLDNWNEYGEGHFMYPTALNGFGYLDALRNVFGDGGVHEDTVPTQAQKDRVCVLYPQDRVLPVKTAVKPSITDTYSLKWNFDTDGNAEGWETTINHISGLSVQNGVLSAVASGNDPWLTSLDNLGFSAEDNPYVHIRIKNSTGDTHGRIYFATEADTALDENKGVSFILKPNDTGYTDYYVDMWSNAKWTGKIKFFRIDPISAQGDFSIDSIGVVYSPMQGVKTYLDGQMTKMLNMSKVIDGCAMVPIEEIYYKLGIPKQWNDNPKKFIAVKGTNIFELIPGVSEAYKDGVPMNLEHAPVLDNGVLYAPVSFLKQAFGYIVSWSEADQEISIYTSSLTWNFNAAEGWTANDRISGVVIKGGYYNGTSAGTGGAGEEGYITSKDKLSIEALSVKRIRVNYKNSTPGNELKLYFTTASDPVWDSNKMMVLPAVVQDNGYREYVFDTSSFGPWSGVIKQIRLMPTNMAGSFSIDNIKMDITTSIPVKGDNLIIDSGMEMGANSQIINSQILREYSTSQAHSGNQAIKVTKQSNYGSIYFNTLKQIAGQEYYYSAWLKLDENSVSLTSNPPKYPVAKLCLQYKLDGLPKQKIIFSSAALSGTKWIKVQGNYRINEPGVVTEIRMFIYTDSPAALDTFYIDDVEIIPVTYTSTPEWIHVSGITLNKEYTVIAPGTTEKLIASIQPSNAINRDLVWSSDNTEAVIVDLNGYIYAKSAGTANIQATTVEGGLSAVCEVVVGTLKSVTGVELNKAEEDIAIGNSNILTAAILPSDASYKKVKWSSSNQSVATVSNSVYNPIDGTTRVTVSAIGLGTADITVTTIDGNKTAVCTFNVMNPDVMTLYLISRVNDMGLEQGVTNSLTSKLNNVYSSIMRGDKISSANQLNAFINEVNAQSGNKLTAEQANELKAAANKIITAINIATEPVSR